LLDAQSPDRQLRHAGRVGRSGRAGQHGHA
jgi:hypothetical protein